MFASVLIANRGEIACRIARTCRALGVRSIGVFSDADRGAAHVAACDAAVHIGGALPAESYLCADRIVQAALSSGAEAIHPGYGFLSENPEFVEAVEAAGLCFVGPSAQAIQAMGLKDNAKALMAAAGVPVVPGYHGASQQADVLRRAAGRLGYPVLIKAVAGGGGKGMRLVERPDQFEAALASAQAEALAAFGNEAVLIEKYIAAPRHIEVQIFGDGRRAVHLFERDCSMQRRHQKVIEEAPAPGMSAEMRAAMGNAAVQAAAAIGYAGAGTVEFIVDTSDGLRPDRFWFMEMNTRLQVEHPVTEMITGIDLVDWQLRVAAGEALPAGQEDLEIKGHAIEARLYAEDVRAGFLPATGTIDHLSFAPGVRVDSGVRAGDAVTSYYDPMIAKLICLGEDRAQALAHMAQALAQTQVAGCVTNLGFLSRLIAHKGFAEGDLDTGLIARDLAQLSAYASPSDTAMAQAVLMVAGLWDGLGPMSGLTLWTPLEQRVALIAEDGPIEARLRFEAGAVEVLLPGASVVCRYEGGAWRLGEEAGFACHQAGDEITVFKGAGHVWRIPDPIKHAKEGGLSSGAVLSPMPGRIAAVLAQPGESVEIGDRLVVVEAMKMEHALQAQIAGRIGAVHVVEGDQVQAQQVLILIEEAGE